MITGRTVLIALELLAASTWVGSLVCLALVARVARRVLDEPARVTLFRGIGRIHGIVGSAALVIAIGAGVAIAGRPSHWTGGVALALILSLLLVVLTGVGMLQARAMTVRRWHALDTPHDETCAKAIRRGAAIAGALRGSIALVTLVILALGAHLIDG
jgi:hypothetical protein